jgi:CubicO group peptidase (beta-lactamase class C family)
MARPVVALAATLMVAAVGLLAQGTPPATQAVEQLRRFLEVFNRGDRVEWQRLVGEFASPPPGPFLDQQLALRAQTGGFELVSIENASATGASAVVRERDAEGTGARITLEIEAAAPRRIVAVRIEPGLRVPVQVARLSEDALVRAVEAEVRRRADADQFSGAVLIARRGRPVYQSAWGFADRERRVANRLDTRFRNGSMNKMFTAVAVLTLVQAGRVRLDAPIGTYLTGYPNPSVATRVTVHQLLTHTGGLGDVFGPELSAIRDQLRQHGDYVRRFAQQPLLFEPGSRWMYSNYGFILLGAIIEAVSGQNYYDYVRDHVYRPAGMTDTGSQPESEAVPRRAIGYMRPPGTQTRIPNDPTLPYRATAAGGGYTTMADLMRFTAALSSGRLLDAKHTALLTTGTVDALGGKYAYGFVEYVADGVRSFGHGGNAPGMDADLRIFPDSGYVVAVLANVDPPSAQRVSEFISNRVPPR